VSREDVRLEGYEPGNGYQPADFISLRDLFTGLVLILVCLAVRELIREIFGYDVQAAPFAILGGSLIVGLRAKLNAERLKDVITEEDARRARIGDLVSIMLDTVIAALAIGSIIFLAVRVKW